MSRDLSARNIELEDRRRCFQDKMGFKSMQKYWFMIRQVRGESNS